MKKLALVLGSLLVVGTAATAKEVMPAPVVVPEKVVEVVEKPVIVYRDREVAPAWRPSGSVDVHLRNWGKVENQSNSKRGKNNAGWEGSEEYSQLRTTTRINFTPNQTLEIATRHKYGLDGKNNDTNKHERIQLTHFYNFGNLGSSKVDAKWRTQFRHTDSAKHLETGIVFDFAEYFFKNDYVKTTALEIAPFYRYNWARNGEYTNNFGLYANAEFELPWGVTFQAEFDDLYNYASVNNAKGNKDLKAQTGTVELTLAKEFELYKAGKHTLGFETELVYATNWSYSKKLDSILYKKSDLAVDAAAGTLRDNGKKERWGAYEAKIDPHFNYAFQATDFVKLYARVGAEYVNRENYRHAAKYWRWQPYARVGFKATF